MSRSLSRRPLAPRTGRPCRLASGRRSGPVLPATPRPRRQTGTLRGSMRDTCLGCKPLWKQRIGPLPFRDAEAHGTRGPRQFLRLLRADIHPGQPTVLMRMSGCAIGIHGTVAAKPRGSRSVKNRPLPRTGRRAPLPQTQRSEHEQAARGGFAGVRRIGVASRQLGIKVWQGSDEMDARFCERFVRLRFVRLRFVSVCRNGTRLHASCVFSHACTFARRGLTQRATCVTCAAWVRRRSSPASLRPQHPGTALGDKKHRDLNNRDLCFLVARTNSRTGHRGSADLGWPRRSVPLRPRCARRA